MSSSYYAILTSGELADHITNSTHTTGGYIYSGDVWYDGKETSIVDFFQYDILSCFGNKIVDRVAAHTDNQAVLDDAPEDCKIEHCFMGDAMTSYVYRKMNDGRWEVIKYEYISPNKEFDDNWSLAQERGEQAATRVRALKAKREREAFKAADTRFAALAALKGR